MTDRYKQDLAHIANHYSALIAKYGNAPQGAQWPDRRLQELRMEILCQIGIDAESKVLDFGCGTGHFLQYIKKTRSFRGDYVGYDICNDAIQLARKIHPDARFETRNILESDIPEMFDYVVINGTFNNRVSDNWGLMTEILSRLYSRTKKGLAFNALSRFVEYFDSNLYYADPLALFRFCKECLSPCITLRHDYQLRAGVIPYEFTMYIFASPLRPVPLKQTSN